MDLKTPDELHELMLNRLQKEIDRIAAEAMSLQLDADTMAVLMLQPVFGHGMPPDPEREAAAQKLRKGFKVLKGKKQ